MDENLHDAVLTALNAFFKDMSVSPKETLISLQVIRDELVEMIEQVKKEVEKDELEDE